VIFRFTIILLFTLLFNLDTLAQQSMFACSDSSFCIPGVIGLPRSKGLVIKNEVVKDYKINSVSSDGNGSAEGEVSKNRRWEFTIRAPILNKDQFKIAVGFNYFVEEYRFENSQNLSFPLYTDLEDRSLKSLKSTLYFVKPTRTNRYYLMRISGSLNGDFRRSFENNEKYLRFSISPLIGWKKNEYLSYAFGFAYSYSFGRRTIYPLIAYNKSFSAQFGIESILPLSIKLRYNTKNQKNYFYQKTELNGANYNLQLDATNNAQVYLEKAEIRFFVTWEREIHDWLWFGIDAGVRENISYDITDSPNLNAKLLTENTLNTAFIYNISLFVVPPRKFLK
jgi:hypothetical protein